MLNLLLRNGKPFPTQKRVTYWKRESQCERICPALISYTPYIIHCCTAFIRADFQVRSEIGRMRRKKTCGLNASTAQKNRTGHQAGKDERNEYLGTSMASNQGLSLSRTVAAYSIFLCTEKTTQSQPEIRRKSRWIFRVVKRPDTYLIHK